MHAIIMGLVISLYAIIVLHAGYLIQLSFRQPSDKIISTKTEPWLIWIAVSPMNMVFARTVTLAIAIDQVLVALSLSEAFPNGDSILQTICPSPQYLDPQLFKFSRQTIFSLSLLYLGSYIRLQAYAQLGTNFTYRIGKPDELVTSGLYAYVRHPSYAGLLMVLMAMYSLFLRQRGLVSCWAPLVDEEMVTNEKYAYLVPIIGFSCVICIFMVRRVRDEEQMMEREFGEKWKEYKLRTKRFIPYIY